MTNWPLKRIQIGRRFRKDLGDIHSLAESIEAVGLLHPVVVTPQGRLIAGRRRLEAAKLLGWQTIPVHVVDLENIVEGELAENVHRKDFLPSELWAIARKLKEIVRTPVGRPSEKVENCHHFHGKTRDKAAAYFGISRRHLEKIGAVCESEFPELVEELDAEPRSVHRCYQKLKLLRNQQAASDEEIEPVQVGRYKLKENEIICADCREILPRIKDQTFHAIITDPAYGIGQVYNGQKEEADDPEGYWRWFQPTYREMLRVLKPGGFCAIFQGGRYMRHFWDWFGDQDFIIYAAIRQSTAFKGGHGRVASDCINCLHFGDCGGIEPELNLFNRDCLQAYCCRSCVGGSDADAQDCDNVCPNNPKYLELLQEVGGLTFHDLPTITQTPVELPRYVPLVYRRYVRPLKVNWPMVALDTYQIVRVDKDHMGTVAQCGDSLRRTFGLPLATAIVLRGVAHDRPLERYWSYCRRDGVPQLLARLGVTVAVGPNYSHFLDVPRHDNLYNRKRQLLCLAEFAEAGLNPVPHLNAAQPGDWQLWSRFLAGSPSITVVAVEFETGNRSRAEGERAVTELVSLQQSTGRRLHPLIIGGTQFLESVAKEFVTATFLDSTPFMKTVHRQAFRSMPPTGKQRWRKSPTAPDESLDKLLAHNLRCYSDLLDRRWVAIAGEIVRIPTPQRLPLAIAAS